MNELPYPVMEFPEPGPAASGHMTIGDVTSLLTYVSGQIANSEARVTQRMDEFEATLGTIVGRVGDLEGDSHDRALVRQARVAPVKTVAGVIHTYWRDVALLVVGIAAIFGVVIGPL